MSARRLAALLARGLALAAGLLAAMLLAITLTWMLRGGTESGLAAMARLLRHGTTTVDDYRIYPARRLVDRGHRTIVVRLGRSQGELGAGRWVTLLAEMAKHPW